jgi:site-specific recombinase XerD
VRRGVDLYRVKELLGHTVIKTTERYSHLQQSQLEEAVATLEDIQ